jgi:hypothetical protein
VQLLRPSIDDYAVNSKVLYVLKHVTARQTLQPLVLLIQYVNVATKFIVKHYVLFLKTLIGVAYENSLVVIILGSSAVERAAVNRSVVGSTPTLEEV